MARRQYNDGMEVVHGDQNAEGALIERELYDRVIYEMLQRVGNGFFGDSLQVSFVGATTVSVNQGSGFQTDNTQVNPEPTKRLVFLPASVNKNLSTPDGVNDRIDLICAKSARAISLNETRKFKSSGGVISNVAFDVENDWLADIIVVAGTPAGSPVAPSVPSGYIKLAELLVSAVTGLSGSGAITDSRVLLPVGGAVAVNTVGKVRVTAGAAVPLSTLISDIDALLKFGYQNYTDFDVLGADPAVPAASRVRFYQKGGVFYFRESGGTINPVGSGGGGGGSSVWNPVPGNAPTEDVENNEKIFLFESGQAQKLELFVKVPQGYIAGRQILMYIGQYSPSSANTQLLSCVTSLVRKNLDAITTVANQHSSGNTAITNTVASQLREVSLPLTSSVGAINGFSVSPGDLLKVELTRGTDTDTADIRFIPSATEVKFG